VSDDLFIVLQQGQRLAGISRGAFDLTSGPYTELWRRAAAAAGRAPSQAELEDARLRVGWEKLRLDTIERTAMLTVADMRLDPAGIALGYAADQVMEQLRLRGCERARVEVGNVVLVGAAPPGAEGWTVGLRNVPSPREPRSVTLVDAAVAFSPGARPPGKTNAGSSSRIPLISPTNGRPVPLVPVAVVARRAAHAQSVAAAAAVLGPGAGESLSRNVRGARVRFGGKPSAAGAGGR
jgi:thiamine biosynthesis lipoprotein